MHFIVVFKSQNMYLIDLRTTILLIMLYTVLFSNYIYLEIHQHLVMFPFVIYTLTCSKPACSQQSFHRSCCQIWWLHLSISSLFHTLAASATTDYSFPSSRNILSCSHPIHSLSAPRMFEYTDLIKILKLKKKIKIQQFLITLRIKSNVPSPVQKA